MLNKERLMHRYPTAVSVSFGDSPALADHLAELIVSGKKTGSCCSLEACLAESDFPVIGAYSIVENGRGEPVCIIRTTRLHLLRFSDVTSDLAQKEGEGDGEPTLEFWRREHRRFFEAEGTFSEEMELIFEEFSLIEVFNKN